MLDFLLAVQHLPALDAEDFSVRLLLDGVQSVYEGVPFLRVAFDHGRVTLVSRFKDTAAVEI